MKKFLWLFGENLGNTSNNNSFYFWQHIVEKEDEIDKKFIIAKNKHNKRVYKRLTPKAKKNIIWKNSIKHYLAYSKADMLYVSLSYKDVEPKRILKRVLKTPIVYLQHGTLAIKKIGYEGNSYNNNMFRFLYYNKNIKDILIEENKFKEYQLYYAEFHPRYMELIKRYEQFDKNKSSEKTKNILWFITWREYFGDNKETERLIENIKNVINNYKIREYLKNSNSKLKICLHQFFDKEKIEYMTEKLKNQNIEIVTPKQIDVMDEIVKNDILITDYSSIGFDFTILGKKVILYQPDIKDYSKVRDFYYLEEMKKYSVKTPSKLVQELEKDSGVNNFFRNKLPTIIDFEYLKQGKHIDKLYEEFCKIQKNEITFIGYNFYGKGGTVSATLALAEGLLEKNYLVKLISLKKHIRKGRFPFGLNVTALYFSKKRTIQYIVKRLLFFDKRHYGYLKYDSNCSNLIPYTGYALKKKLNKIKSRTVVSTRETIHLFLKNAKSDNIKNKIYFFHTYYGVLQKQFGGLIEELKKYKLERAVFITEAGKKQYKEKARI